LKGGGELLLGFLEEAELLLGGTPLRLERGGEARPLRSREGPDEGGARGESSARGESDDDEDGIHAEASRVPGLR